MQTDTKFGLNFKIPPLIFAYLSALLPVGLASQGLSFYFLYRGKPVFALLAHLFLPGAALFLIPQQRSRKLVHNLLIILAFSSYRLVRHAFVDRPGI
ncbi:MAG: hypothetical protein ACE5GM_04700 [bacterium]